MSVIYADVSKLSASFAAAAQRGIYQASSDVIRTAAYQIQDEAKARAPFKRGRLRDSITVTFPSPQQARIGPTVPYGVYQEFGTGTRGEFPGAMYEIRPVRANALVFQTADGKWVTTKLVKHPGIKARPYMRPAAKAVLDQMARNLAVKGVEILLKSKL